MAKISITIFLMTMTLNKAFSQSYVRSSIKNYFSNSSNLEAYQKGVKEMKRRSQLNPNDPTGWLFQANIHGSSQNNPNWNKCQHRHWWFLAWHRAYLYYFERILRSASGNPNLTLPYWDYTDQSYRQLPTQFSSGELYEEGRTMNRAGTELPPNTVSITRAFASLNYTNNSFNTGFGGGSVPSPVQFNRFNLGLIEDVPHNQIHGQVGGKMANALTAAQDPIFWSHHANIDRLWEIWLLQGNGRVNPSETLWLNQSFELFDENGSKVSIKVSDLVDLKKLGYTYDKLDISPALTSSATISSNKLFLFVTKSKPDTTITISSKNINLKSNTTEIKINSKKINPTFKSLFSFNEDTAKTNEFKKVYLSIEEIEFDKILQGSIEVYINLPLANYKSNSENASYAGIISLFGMLPKTDNHSHHHNGTLHSMSNSIAVDITEAVNRLKERGEWNENNFRLSFVIRGPNINGEPQNSNPETPIKFGKIKLDFVK